MNEEQMDYWVKTAETTEIIEQAVINLLTETPYAFAKSLEWCRGKKFMVKYCGLLMMGRLALTSKNDIDEMFELFFEVIPPLAKDSELFNILYRSTCQLARRSRNLHTQCVSFAEHLTGYTENNAQKLGKELIRELTSDDFKSIIK